MLELPSKDDESRPVSITRLNVPLILALVALAALLGGWGVASVARAKLDDTATDVAELKAKAAPDAAWRQHVEDRLDETAAALDRIERKLGTSP